MNIQVRVVAVPELGNPLSEDAHIVLPQGHGVPFMAAAVDGHGGRGKPDPAVANFSLFVARSVIGRMVQEQHPSEFPRVFNETQAMAEATFNTKWVGAVGAFVMIHEGDLWSAHVGDSRLYRWTPGGLECLTVDHQLTSQSELERLGPFFADGSFEVATSRDSQGIVSMLRSKKHPGYLLMPTRGFGDLMFRPALIHQPDVKQVGIRGKRSGEIFILCSDGAVPTLEYMATQPHRPGQQTSLDQLAWNFRRNMLPDDDITAIFFQVEL